MSSVTTTMTTSQPSHNEAAVETSASQKEGPRSRSWHRYRRHIVWDATVWVFLLVIPLVHLLLGSFALWQRLLGIAGVMGFIVAYVWAFSTQDTRAVRAGDPLPDLPIRVLVGKLAALILFSALALPALGCGPPTSSPSSAHWSCSPQRCVGESQPSSPRSLS